MKQSPRIRNPREDHAGSTALHNCGHYTRFQGDEPGHTKGFGPRLRSGLIVAAASLCTALAACTSTPDAPETRSEPTQQRSSTVAKPRVELAERAPEKYVVKKGDTLWDISAMFLKDPWLWPEIWYTNPQIQNPHLIYPGDIITIFWYDGQPQLRITRDGEIYQTTLPVERLSPQVRTMPLEQAIPTIPADAIRAFVGAPRTIDEDDYEELPYVLRSRDGRELMGEADRVFVRTVDEDDTLERGRYHIIRIGDEYEDPATGDDLGYQTREVGEGVIELVGETSVMLITDSNIETLVGDRLIPAEDTEIRTDFLPHAPAEQVEGQIIDVIDGMSNIGQYQVVTLNLGASDGMEPGHVLDIYQRGKKVSDEVEGGSVRLPDLRAGTLMIFRTEDRVSYALVMEAFSEIHLLDFVRNP